MKSVGRQVTFYAIAIGAWILVARRACTSGRRTYFLLRRKCCYPCGRDLPITASGLRSPSA
jgi:hypothetical protein